MNRIYFALFMLASTIAFAGGKMPASMPPVDKIELSPARDVPAHFRDAVLAFAQAVAQGDLQVVQDALAPTPYWAPFEIPRWALRNSITITLNGEQFTGTPLHVAAIFNQPDVMFALLEYGNQHELYHLFDQTDEGGLSALHLAVRGQDTKVLAVLLNVAPQSDFLFHKIIRLDANLRTALHIAARAGNLHAVNVFIDFAVRHLELRGPIFERTTHAKMSATRFPELRELILDGDAIVAAVAEGQIDVIHAMMRSPHYRIFEGPLRNLDLDRNRPEDLQAFERTRRIVLEYVPVFPDRRGWMDARLERAVMMRDLQAVMALTETASLHPGLLAQMLANARNLDRTAFQDFLRQLEAARMAMSNLNPNPDFLEHLNDIITILRRRLAPPPDVRLIEDLTTRVLNLGRYGGLGQFADATEADEAMQRMAGNDVVFDERFPPGMLHFAGTMRGLLTVLCFQTYGKWLERP
jgi:hypothetical protein